VDRPMHRCQWFPAHQIANTKVQGRRGAADEAGPEIY
jgi:hypothetical protein